MKVSRFDPVTFTALICVVAYLESALAQDSTLERKAHFLYMKKLREYLSESQAVLPGTVSHEASEQGQLVATSIEASSAAGPGFSGNGILLQDTQDTTFHFNIPRQNRSEATQVELWLFPDKSHATENQILEVSAVACAAIEGVSNERKYSLSFVWDTREDCAVADLTPVSNWVYNKLRRRSLNESDVSVELEIGTVASLSSVEVTPKRVLDRALCSAMKQRQTNDSFLIVKNYVQESVETESRRRRRQQTSEEDEPEEITVPPSNFSSPYGTNQPCQLVPLVVNLTELYSSFLKEPKVVDIKDCSGKCALMLNEKVFSKHAQVKERLKLLPGREYLSSFEPLCTPIKFKPLLLLIALQEKSTVIVHMSDFVADKCSCQ